MNNEMTEAQATEVPFNVPEGFRLVSDEEAEALARQIVEDHREKWEIQEIVDSAVESGELNALMRNEFYWEYTQSGRKIRGLTAAMISHLATARGISEVIEHRNYVETDDTHAFEVVVSMRDPLNPDDKLYRSGFAEEPKTLNSKPDKFSRQKAYTKSFRNACLKLLPQDLVIAAIYKLAKLVPVDWKPPRQALPPAKNGALAQNGNNRARSAAFAKYKTRKTDLEALGITEAIFKTGVYAHYDVKSSNEMTENQCSDLEISLDVDGEFADWITALAPKQEGAAESKSPSF